MEKFFSLMETMLANPIFWGVVAFVAIAFTLSGRFSVSAATICLWIAWGAAVFGLYRAEIIIKFDPLLRFLILIAGAAVLAIGAVLLSRWFVQPKQEQAQVQQLPPNPSEEPEKPQTRPPQHPKHQKPQGKGTSEPSSAEQMLPDVTLRFVYPKSPAVVLENSPRALARDIKWSVVLWNLDLPDRNDPLQIPVQTFDWLRPGDYGGPQDIFGTPLVAPFAKAGNRLMGSASVICPNCERGHSYIVYIVLNQGGWYAELKGEKSGSLIIPQKFDPGTRTLFFQRYETMVPETERIPINDWP